MQKKEQSFQTKQLLADALKEALKYKSLDKIRIRELTDRCGIYRQTFYYHFTDLEALLLWTAQRDIDYICSGQDGAETLQKRVEHLLQHTMEYRGFYLAVVEGNSYPVQRKVLYSQIITLLSQSLGKNHTDLLFPFQNYTAIVSSLLEQWIRGSIQQSLDDMTRCLTELFGETYISSDAPIQTSTCY